MQRRRRTKSRTQTEGLSEAKTLTAEQIFQRTFSRATKLLAARSRSTAELRELLLKGRQSSKEAVEEVITRLREYGYLDDERFAFGYASLKVQQRPLGRQRLKRDLTVKKVDRATADEALDLVFRDVSEEELIDRAIEKRMRIRGRPENRAQAKSLFDYLLRLGFPLELVSEKVRAASKKDLDDETTD
jgi:regulatory protein